MKKFYVQQKFLPEKIFVLLWKLSWDFLSSTKDNSSFSFVYHFCPPLTYKVDKAQSPVCGSLLTHVHNIRINPNKITGTKDQWPPLALWKKVWLRTKNIYHASQLLGSGLSLSSTHPQGNKSVVETYCFMTPVSRDQMPFLLNMSSCSNHVWFCWDEPWPSLCSYGAPCRCRDSHWKHAHRHLYSEKPRNHGEDMKIMPQAGSHGCKRSPGGFLRQGTIKGLRDKVQN